MKDASVSVMPVTAGSGCVVAVLPPVPVWKKVFDYAWLAFLFPMAAPLMGVIALAIKVVHGGPVLFRQPRIGRGGKPFVCLKFRTMRTDADPTVHQRYMEELMRTNGRTVKLERRGDRRLLALGEYLRLLCLDELPQLINVLRGEMSLVGPRPCTPEEFQQYALWQRRRVAVLPGLTGLWQVNDKEHTPFEEMIRLDLLYVDTCSPWLDFKIIARTPPVLAAGLRSALRLARVKLKAAWRKVARKLAPLRRGGPKIEGTSEPVVGCHWPSAAPSIPESKPVILQVLAGSAPDEGAAQPGRQPVRQSE